MANTTSDRNLIIKEWRIKDMVEPIIISDCDANEEKAFESDVQLVKKLISELCDKYGFDKSKVEVSPVFLDFNIGR